MIAEPKLAVTERLTPADLDRAAALLREGRLVAFPTETVYGLGADATNAAAVAAIFAAKARPRFNPLIVHVTDEAAARRLVVFDARAAELARRFWPGPLTLVLRRRPDCPVALLASAGLDSLAVRVPAHPLPRALIRAVGRPIAAPSANRSGRVSPTTAEHVLDELDGRIAAVLDGGACRVGLESTVVDLTGVQPVLLRPGGVPAEAIEAVVGPLAPPAAGSAEAKKEIIGYVQVGMTTDSSNKELRAIKVRISARRHARTMPGMPSRWLMDSSRSCRNSRQCASKEMTGRPTSISISIRARSR
jgi:L-threonylcarbamoyladenylate synthase